MSDLASVGQHFMVGLRPTTTLHPQDRQLLQDLHPAGVVLFKSNFSHDLPYREWLDGHARLIAAIREATGRERLLIAIDHEGGRVCRTPAPMTRYSYARSWEHRCGEVGAAMGMELSSLGINLNFAPVLDLDSLKNLFRQYRHNSDLPRCPLSRRCRAHGGHRQSDAYPAATATGRFSVEVRASKTPAYRGPRPGARDSAADGAGR